MCRLGLVDVIWLKDSAAFEAIICFPRDCHMRALRNLICFALCYFWEVLNCIFILSLCETSDIISLLLFTKKLWSVLF